MSNINPKYHFKPTDDELAERWHKKFPETAYVVGKFRRYSAGYWPEIDKVKVKKEILGIITKAKSEGIRPSNHLLSSVVAIARTNISVESKEWDVDEDIIVLENGTLHIPTMTLRKHDPQDLVTYSLPFRYDPHTKADNLLRVLSRFPADVVALLQEFVGLSLTTDMRYEKALWLVGEPGGGKSTFIDAIETVAADRCIHLCLSDLSRSRFALHNLPGKTVAYATEQPAGNSNFTQTLNALISGERSTTERKFCDSFDFYPKAKFIWAMNEKPNISTANDGLFRRIIIVEFPLLPEDERDPGMKDRIKREGPGIVNWALEGLKRLRERGKFIIPQSAREAVAEYKRSLDIPALFLEDCFLRDTQSLIPAQELYDRYKTWCQQNGYEPKSNVRVAADWKRLGLVRVEANGRRYWKGVRVKTPF